MENRRGGGAKLNRTEVVYVRLDPMVHQGAQLAAARERRTLSSFVECAVEERLKVISSGVQGRSIWNVLEETWDPEPANRFAKLAFFYPHLLSHSELRLWEIICNRPYFWLGSWNAQQAWYWYCKPQYLLVDRLIEHWPVLARIMAGELDESTLPRVAGEIPAAPPSPGGPQGGWPTGEQGGSPFPATSSRQAYPQPSFGGSPDLGLPLNAVNAPSPSSDYTEKSYANVHSETPLERELGPSDPERFSTSFRRVQHARTLRSGESAPSSEPDEQQDKRRKRS